MEAEPESASGRERARSSSERSIVDDDKGDRYLIKETLSALGQFEIIEAEPRRGCPPAWLVPRKPNVIFLDLVLPDMSGFEILDRLKADAVTRRIPVIVNTSKVLDDDERGRLLEQTVSTLEKGNSSQAEVIAQVRDSLSKAGLRPPAFARAAGP